MFSGRETVNNGFCGQNYDDGCRCHRYDDVCFHRYRDEHNFCRVAAVALESHCSSGVGHCIDHDGGDVENSRYPDHSRYHNVPAFRHNSFCA